jgi:DNA-directed RNA polymerase specialized sigma24 family protein
MRHLPDPGVNLICIGRDRSRCELNEQLVGDLRARHPEALESLLDEYGRVLQGVAFHILRSHADAEEVVIDTMVSAFGNRRRLSRRARGANASLSR